MSKKLNISALIVIVISTFGCAASEDIGVRKGLCSNTWYSLVEKQLNTGDGRGHGPDMGSLEWRSVVEFKLGARGDSEIPALDTDQWCDYIDTHYIRQRT